MKLVTTGFAGDPYSVKYLIRTKKGVEHIGYGPCLGPLNNLRFNKTKGGYETITVYDTKYLSIIVYDRLSDKVEGGPNPLLLDYIDKLIHIGVLDDKAIIGPYKEEEKSIVVTYDCDETSGREMYYAFQCLLNMVRNTPLVYNFYNAIEMFPEEPLDKLFMASHFLYFSERATNESGDHSLILPLVCGGVKELPKTTINRYRKTLPPQNEKPGFLIADGNRVDHEFCHKGRIERGHREVSVEKYHSLFNNLKE